MYRVSVKKETILSAGTINNPQILMLSGIGPKMHLNELKIPIVADLSGVGQNFHDHVYVHGNEFSSGSNTVDLLSDKILEEYLTNLTGPLSHTHSAKMIMNSGINDDDDDDDDHQWPDMILYTQMILKNSETPSLEFTLNNFFVAVGRPKSRGFIRLKSSNPYDYPMIQPNFLTHPYDIKVLIDAYRWTFIMASTDVFKRNNVTISEALVPGCERLYKPIKVLRNGIKMPSDDYIECAVRHMTEIGHHWVGTCKMGSHNDPTAVVTPKLKVYKVNGLRVIDASIMPTVTFANINAPTYMIAERGVQFIKDEYNLI